MSHKDELLRQIREIRGTMSANAREALERQARVASAKKQVNQVLASTHRRQETLNWVRTMMYSDH